MSDIGAAFSAAFNLMLSMDRNLLGIVGLSLRVSLLAVALASLVALPLGAALALARFPGRMALIAVLNAFMGLPPVVVGLVLYVLLSRSGPLGFLGLLFSPTAMILAQMFLVIPIVAAISRQVIEDLWSEYAELLRSLCATLTQSVATLLWDARFSLITGILAGFGRAISEVGAILIVGGNIAYVTRTMTTAIALETSKGNLALAMGLGIILLGISLLASLAAQGVRYLGLRRYA
ncbi:MAG: ABC transporter permease [SAR324 cluster bacterium]